MGKKRRKPSQKTIIERLEAWLENAKSHLRSYRARGSHWVDHIEPAKKSVEVHKQMIKYVKQISLKDWKDFDFDKFVRKYLT